MLLLSYFNFEYLKLFHDDKISWSHEQTVLLQHDVPMKTQTQQLKRETCIITENKNDGAEFSSMFFEVKESH